VAGVAELKFRIHSPPAQSLQTSVPQRGVRSRRASRRGAKKRQSVARVNAGKVRFTTAADLVMTLETAQRQGRWKDPEWR